MVKIKRHLFEGVACCFALLSAGLVFTTLLFIIAIIGRDKEGFLIVLEIYVACILLSALLLLIFLICIRNTKKCLIVTDKYLKVTGLSHDLTYDLDSMIYCEYYVCKWYAMLILYFYKHEMGGAFIIKMSDGEELHYYIMYHDYLKIKRYIKNISEK